MWFGSLPVGSFTTFEELAAKFMSQYSYLTSKKPTISDLQDTTQGPNENVQTFIGRFRELLVKTEVVIPESQAVQMIIQNLRDPLRALMLLGPVRTYVELYERASQLERNLKKGMLFSTHYFSSSASFLPSA